MQAIERYRVNEILLVPTMIQMLVDHPAIGAHDLSSLRRIAVRRLADERGAARPRHGRAARTSQFVQAYGMTELSPVATILHHRDSRRRPHAGPAPLRRARRRSACEIRIVDADDTAGAARHGRRDLRQRRRGDAWATGNGRRRPRSAVVDGWMHTGDGGYMDDDGFVFIVDRIKDMIVTGGENVYSAEVENVVAQHPGGRAMRGDRHPERAVGRGGARGRRAAARRDGGRRGADRVLPRSGSPATSARAASRCAMRRCRCRARARS